MPARRLVLLTLLAAAVAARPAGAQEAAPAGGPADTLPATVVQRFVDAANARDAAAMSALVAPDAVFERFPAGGVLAAGRDSVHAFYARLLPRLSPGFRITVEPRIVDGGLVIDQEHFTGTPAEQGSATWMYQVRGGLIQRAWVLDGRPDARPAPPASDSAEVAAALDRFLRAFERLDWDTFRQSFADDATVFYPSAATPERHEGRAAFEARFQREFADIRAGAPGGPPYMELRPLDLGIRVLAPGVASVTFELRNDRRHARRTIVFRRDGAAWRIAHLHASNVPWPDQPAR